MGARKEFDALDASRADRRVAVGHATRWELSSIYPRAAEALAQQMASPQTCESIRRRHRDNIWAIRDRRNNALIGIYAMAMLTEDGHRALLAGEFEAHDPRLAHVAETGERVSAIYKWGIFAPGIAAAAIPLISRRLNVPPYDDINLYGTGSTVAGRRIMTSVGFRKLETLSAPNLYHYERLGNRASRNVNKYFL